MSKLQPFNGELQMRCRKFRNHVTNCVNMARKEHYKAQYDKCCGNTNEKQTFVMSFIKKDTNGSDEKIHLGYDGDQSISVADNLNDFFIWQNLIEYQCKL